MDTSMKLDMGTGSSVSITAANTRKRGLRNLRWDRLAVMAGIIAFWSVVVWMVWTAL